MFYVRFFDLLFSIVDQTIKFVILIKSFIWVYWFMITFPHLKYALSEFFNSKIWKIFLN